MPGSNCTTVGLTLDRLPLMPGYWRADRSTTDVRRCPDATKAEGSGCQGLPDAPCKHGLTGVYCLTCVGNSTYYDAEASECRLCATTLLNWELLLSLLAATLVVLVVSVARRSWRRCIRDNASRDHVEPQLIVNDERSPLSAPLCAPEDRTHLVEGESAENRCSRVRDIAASAQRRILVLLTPLKICW